MAVSSKCQSHVQRRLLALSMDCYFFTNPPYHPPKFRPSPSLTLYVTLLQPYLYFVFITFSKVWLASVRGKRGGLLLTLTLTFWQLLFRAQLYQSCYCSSEVTDVGNSTERTHQHFIGFRRGQHFTLDFSITCVRMLYALGKTEALKINIQKLFRAMLLKCTYQFCTDG